MIPWVGTPRPPRAWQAQALPLALEALETDESGVIVACTGAGKSIVIAELCHQLVVGQGRTGVVVTTPTRALVDQLAATIAARLGPGMVGRFFTGAKEFYAPVVVTCNPSGQALAAARKAAGIATSVLIADECHRTEADALQAAVAALAPARLLGFTATPFRSIKSETLQLFTKVIYRYDLRDALRDGVIVPWKVIPWTVPGVELDQACLEMIKAHGAGPMVANASSISDAEAFAAKATAAGISAEAMHSKLTPAEMAARMRRLEQGVTRLVVYPSLLSEGADFPFLVTLVLRRKLKARVRFIQEIGRVLRTFPGKLWAIILDPHGLFELHSLLNDSALGAAEGEVEEELDDDSEGEGAERFARPVLLAPLDPPDLWASQLRAAAEFDRLVTPRLPLEEARGKKPTDRQIKALRACVGACDKLPPEHGRLAFRLITASAVPSAMAAGHLLDVLVGVQGKAERWAPTLPVWAPDLDLGAMVVEAKTETVWAEGTVTDRWTGVVVVRGVKTVVNMVRPRLPGETVTSATIRAVLAAEAELGQARRVLVSDPAIVSLFDGRWKPAAGSVADDLLKTRVCFPEVGLATKSPAARRLKALMKEVTA